MRGRARAAVLAVVAVVVGGACRDSAREERRPPAVVPPTTQPPLVYVAVGASESAGVGADRPAEEAWPRVLHRIALPAGSVLVNLGIPGATVADALRQELPQALAQEPDLVTVWLNVNDIIRGVSPDLYERQLGQLVRALRRGGATRVLVANTPRIDLLPVYQACRAQPPTGRPPCPGGAPAVPDALVDAYVAAYNAAIARVAQREGAVLVDLHAASVTLGAAGGESFVSADGFHPSTTGHRAVAELFAQALSTPGRASPG